MKNMIRAIVLICVFTLSLSHFLPAAASGPPLEGLVEAGQSATVGDYEITVTGIDDNANETIADADDSNAEPPEGYAYVVVAAEATYTGAETGSPAFELAFHVLGASGQGISSQYGACGTVPDDMFEGEELNPGDTASFNICWLVPAQDPAALVMYVDPLLGTGEGIVWFSLGMEPPVLSAPTVPEGVVTANAKDAAAAVGVTGQTGSYLLTVTGVETDATDTVVAMDSFNEPPADGYRYVVATVTVTYLGETVGDPELDLGLVAFGPDGTEYSTNADSCGVVDNDVMSTGDLFAGAVANVNLCWQVPADDAGALLLRVSSYGNDSGEPVWFTLQPA
jgi:hypothetical protein